MNLKGVVTSSLCFHKLINCFDRFDLEIAVGANKYQNVEANLRKLIVIMNI
jgi:hypothetical protein